MNSIFAYTMTEIFRGWFNRSILIFSKPLFTLLLDRSHAWEATQKPASFPWPAQLGAWGDVLQAILVLLAPMAHPLLPLPPPDFLQALTRL